MTMQRSAGHPPAPVAAAAVVELAAELVRRASVTPDDAGCQALIARRLEVLGFRCESILSGGVTNLWARRGASSPLVCFAGHTDVVPTGPVERWSAPPFAATVTDGWLAGRGAADMKGSLAAFVVAAEAFVAAHPDAPGSLALLLTSDAEGPATDGTVRVVERLAAAGTRLDYCIVGEPSSTAALGDTLKNGRRGSLSGTLVVEGVQGHIAYPHLAKNPIHLAAPVIAELAATEWDAGNDHFPPTTWQCSNVRAGTGATNVIPGTLEVDFNFRHGTASSRESLQARFEAVLRRHGLAYRLQWTGWGDPYLTPRGRLVDAASAVIGEVTGRRPELSTSGGTSDGRVLAAISDEVIELGPVNATIHQIDERVRVDDLVALATIHLRLLERLLLPPTAATEAAP